MTKLEHNCIDCTLPIVCPDPKAKMCACDFKSLSTKEKPKLMKIAKEVENHIVWLANVESNKAWAIKK